MDSKPDDNPARPVETRNARQLLRWGLVISAVYVGLMVGYGCWVGPTMLNMLQRDPDKFATFLSGVFAPLAFLWLVLGFKQQGDELQNSARALWLQGEELRNSVEQQRQLVDVTREQLDIERRGRAQEEASAEQAAQPLLFMTENGSSVSDGLRTFRYLIESGGPPCSAVDVWVSGEYHGSPNHFAAGHKYHLIFDFEAGELPEPASVQVQYTDTRGHRRAQNFLIPIFETGGPGSYVALGNPQKVAEVEKLDGSHLQSVDSSRSDFEAL